MASNGQNFVANKDTILKEGWFKKRNFRGEVGKSYSKRWFVLSARYIEWYDFPNGKRSQAIPLDHCYCRIHEGTGLIIGSFQTSKEWLLRDEGASPAATAGEWLAAINKAIENYRHVGGSSSASGGQQGLVNLADVLAKNQQAQQQAMTNAAPPAAAPAPMATMAPSPMVQAPPPAFSTPAYQPPPPTTVQTTYANPAPVYAPAPAIQTNYAFTPAANPTYATTYTQPVYAPPPMTQTYVQTMAPAPAVTFVAPAPTVTYVQPAPVMMQPAVTYTTYNPMY